MSDLASDGIPPELYQRLLELRPLLERLGCPVRKRSERDTYFLRVRVPDAERGRVQRRFTIPDDAAAYAVQQLLDGWRQEYEAARAEAEERREREREYESKVRELRRVVVEAAGGSSRRRRAAREFDQAAENPMSLYFYTFMGPPALPDLRPGPKPSGRLY